MNFTIPMPARRPAAMLLACLVAVLAPPLARAAVSVNVITSNGTPVAGGAAFSYTITVTNGVGAVTNVLLTDLLPSGALFQNLSVGGTAGGAFDCQGPATKQPGTITCHAFNMAASSAATITVVATYTEEMAGGNRSNTVRVTTGGSQVSSSVPQVVSNNANVQSSQSEQNDGSYFVRLYTVNNSGSGIAFNQMISGSLPPTATFLSAQGTGDFADSCVYDPNSSGFTCAASHLHSGSSYVTLFYADFDSIFANGFD
jgi:uncharacterized repeat protein (TIGR01451 family)